MKAKYKISNNFSENVKIYINFEKKSFEEIYKIAAKRIKMENENFIKKFKK